MWKTNCTKQEMDFGFLPVLLATISAIYYMLGRDRNLLEVIPLSFVIFCIVLSILTWELRNKLAMRSTNIC